MPDPEFAKPKTSYRKLHVFSKAEAIYDMTYFFLQGRIVKSDRTHDQMLQSARSGKQNIVEGRSDAASSAEMEIKLFGVARGSLHELLNDYEDFMRTRHIPFWDQGNPRFVRLLDVCRKHNSTNKMIDKVKADFLRNGGIKEQMYQARIKSRDTDKKDKNK